MLHINTVPLTKEGNHADYWAKLMLDNEKIICVFIHDGKEICTIHGVEYGFAFGTIGMIAHLCNIGNAYGEVRNILQKSEKSECSILKGLSVYGGELHV